MNNFLPLKGWRYNPAQIQDFAQVIAPPYDVIDREQFAALHKQSPLNAVWLDLPKLNMAAAEANGTDPYLEAAGKYQAWKKQGVLLQDAKPCVYLYFQTYDLPEGPRITRKGFFVRRRATPFGETIDGGKVLPHEKTFAGPKADRLKLTQATRANLSAIFGLYSDAENQIAPLLEQFSQSEPVMDFVNGENQRHQVWKVDDAKQVEALLGPLQEKTILIADGHHRYETAVHYAQLARQEAGLEEQASPQDSDYVLMYCCALQDPGLVVLPTHRVLAKLPKISPEAFREALKPYAEFKAYPLAEANAAEKEMMALGKTHHCLAWVHDEQVELMIFSPEKVASHPHLAQMPEAVRQLDVSLLHDLVLAEIIGMPQTQQREYGHIHYVKSFAEAIQLTQEKNTYGFLMNPTKLSEMEAVSQIGETMPQKSTFFYPKLPTGLVFSDLG